jgi:hypothetical protein
MKTLSQRTHPYPLSLPLYPYPHIISMGKAPFFLEIIDISKKKGALPIEIRTPLL